MKINILGWVVVSTTFCVTLDAVADERIYQTTPHGVIRYDKPSYSVKGNRIYETSPQGAIRYDKPGYTIKNQNIYETSPQGVINYAKPLQK